MEKENNKENNKSEEIIQYRTKLLNVAKKTIRSLMEKWERDGKIFTDKNYLKKTGIVPASVGTTSLLLMLDAFKKDPEAISAEDKKRISVIVSEELERIFKFVDEFGFTADPVVDNSLTREIFKDGRGYTDTITWILSIGALVRYTERQNLLNISSTLDEKNKELLLKALRLILDSQGEDGTWGFCSDRESERSLYYSYVVSTSLGDFFDYCLGEIDEVESASVDADDRYIRGKDDGLIEYYRVTYGENLEERVNAARANLQDWLIKTAMPLLPKVASCLPLNRGERTLLGIWDLSENDPYGQYYNLYYAYYLLDMMVTSCTDKRMRKLIDGELSYSIEDLRAEYEKVSDASGGALMNAVDIFYYFRKSEGKYANIERMWRDILEQSIHASRMQYMTASRTENLFWNNAELPLRWNHKNPSIMNEIRGFWGKNGFVVPTDPTLAPLALRANTLYCYYISERTDVAVDRLFVDIEAQRALETTESLERDLWDTNSYSLFVTEKSIEAIVDYNDYLVKVAKEASTQGAVGSPLDSAVDARIVAYLESAKGQKLIEKYAKNVSPAPVSKASESKEDPKPVVSEKKAVITNEEFLGQTSSLLDVLMQYVNSDNEKDHSVYAELAGQLKNLFARLAQHAKKDKLTTVYMDKGADTSGIGEDLKLLDSQIDELILELTRNNDGQRVSKSKYLVQAYKEWKKK